MKKIEDIMNCIKKVMMFILAIFIVNTSFAATSVELMNNGRMLLYRGDIREGVKLLEEAHRMDNTNPYIKLILAKGYSWDNEWIKAKAMYGEIVNSFTPTDQLYWEAKFGIAQITSWEKKYDEALNLYGEILSTYKSISKNFSLDVGLAIGDIYSWQLENDKALDQFNRLLAKDPDNPLILNRIAKIYLWMGEYDQSRVYTNKILSINSKDEEAGERKRVLDQIQTFTANIGYDYTFYDSKNEKGEYVQVHTTLIGLDWQYSIPLKFFTNITEATQNNIENEDPDKASDWNYDLNLRIGGVYRINPFTYLSVAGEYALNAKIFPDYSAEISLSRKLNQNIDIEGLYKYTYDEIDSVQTVDSKQYHLFSPGIIFYYNPGIYNKIQLYVESSEKDLLYSVLMNQYIALNPENILQFYIFISQGRSYLTYSDSSLLQKTTTQSASVVYTHYFNSSWGIEFATGITVCVDKYTNYHAGINGIYKW